MNREEVFGDLTATVQSKIERVTSELESARNTAGTIPKLQADLDRLQAIIKTLTAPQTPSGRKRIGERAAKRKRRETETSALPSALRALGVDALAVPVGEGATAPQCAECHGAGTMDTATTRCTVEGCDAHVCAACLASHNARWHREVA